MLRIEDEAAKAVRLLQQLRPGFRRKSSRPCSVLDRTGQRQTQRAVLHGRRRRRRRTCAGARRRRRACAGARRRRRACAGARRRRRLALFRLEYPHIVDIHVELVAVLRQVDRPASAESQVQHEIKRRIRLLERVMPPHFYVVDIIDDFRLRHLRAVQMPGRGAVAEGKAVRQAARAVSLGLAGPPMLRLAYPLRIMAVAFDDVDLRRRRAAACPGTVLGHEPERGPCAFAGRHLDAGLEVAVRRRKARAVNSHGGQQAAHVLAVPALRIGVVRRSLACADAQEVFAEHSERIDAARRISKDLGSLLPSLIP